MLKKAEDFMIFRTPAYYGDFLCSADKCSDNCCIGWEIGIDDKTAQYYSELHGAFGDRLRQNISSEGCFVLKNERCPFLNENNLCDIIINCGEEHLCQICSDHPRFYEWYTDIKEGGVGLCCEQAARLILTRDDYDFVSCEICEDGEETDEELFSLLFTYREDFFDIVKDEELSFSEKIDAMTERVRELQDFIDSAYISRESSEEKISIRDFSSVTAAFERFEPIDDEWTRELHLLRGREIKNEELLPRDKKEEAYMQRLLIYFIQRHFLKAVFDADAMSKIRFAAVSVFMIKAMCGESSELSCWIEKSKLYSKQMEYSNENMELFYELI